MTRIAGVILYFRAGSDSLIKVIDACLGQSRQFDELMVVDNASGDGVPQSVAQRFPEVVLTTCQSNLGYAAGMNRGFKALGRVPDVCFFITHEVVMHATCVETLARRLEKGAVLVGPRLRLPDGRIWSEGGEISRLGKPKHVFQATTNLAWLDGALLGVDVKTFTALGGFDERFFLYWEDVDLGYRMNKRGRVECASEVDATQRTALTPPYLMARGRILMWRLQRKPQLLAMSLLEMIGGTVTHLLIRRSRAAFEELHLVLQGCKSGITGSLNADLAARRPNTTFREHRES
jgi:N-acetylglucosaminyl-diphospho-decaprenol L-rhamnosyltransferase